MSGVSLKTHNNYEGFEKLFKQLYGKDYKKGDTISRTEEMSNRDWDLFQNYYNQKNAVNDETETFNQTKQNLDDREREARIQADIQMDRLNKYLPQQMRNRGLAGATDLTESALIQAKNNYQNQLGKINNDYTGYQQELLNNYNKNLRTIGNNYESKAEAINATHDAISQNAYDLLMEKLAEYSTSYSALANFEKYFKDNNRELTDEHKQQIESQIGLYKSDDTVYNAMLTEISEGLKSANEQKSDLNKDLAKLELANKIIYSNMPEDRKRQMLRDTGLSEYEGWDRISIMRKHTPKQKESNSVLKQQVESIYNNSHPGTTMRNI